MSLDELIKGIDDGTVVLRKANELYADCQTAIEELCAGCPDERGWSFATGEEPSGAACEYMIADVTDCEHPIVMEYEGRPFCYIRFLRFVRTDYEKYLKRMRGDWS